MATVVNQRDVLLLAASPRILPITLPSNVTVPKVQVSGLGNLAGKDTVTQPDFSTGIEPVGVVNSLPNPSGYTGVKVVFLTTDGKLYRYTGSAWTVAVPAVDVTGQLTNSQIADIAAAKLTGQITETQITDGAISTPKLLAGSVSTAKLAAGSVTTSILAADSVTAANIVAGSVTTSKIAANAITSNELAANSIIAGKISAGAIATSDLSANCVTAAKIAAGTITATEIAAGYVYAGTINAGQITAGTISANFISGGTLSGVLISGVSVNGYNLDIKTAGGSAPLIKAEGSHGGVTIGDFGFCNITSPTINITGGNVSITKGTTISASTIEPVRATSSSSSYAAGVFANSSLGKQIALGGAYAAYAGSGQGKIYAVDGFTPFTGSHEAFISKDSKWAAGDIVYDSKVLYKHDISNTLTEISVTTSANNKAVVGVLNSLAELQNNLDIDEETWHNYTKIYDFVLINSVGEGMLNVCGINGNIEAGDLICSSSISGKGMKQADDIVRNITVAKSRENVTFDFPEQVKQIACIYMCG